MKISFAVALTQIRAVLSVDAVTTPEPSGLKAADMIGPSCPVEDLDRLCRCDVPDRRVMIDRRGDYVRPVGAEISGDDFISMRPQDRDLPAGRRVPNPRRLVQ